MLDDDDLNATDRDIIRLLKIGRCTPRYLAAELDLQQPYVSQRLRRLVEHDRVRRVDRGLYELATGENIHVPEDLADELYDLKGRRATYVELLRELVETEGLDPAPAERGSASAGDTTTIDVETPSTTPPPDPPEVSAEDLPGVDPVLEDLREELPGSGDLLDRRAEAILSMGYLLREEGTAEKSDFLEVAGADELGYEDGDSVWSNMVKGRDTLRALPEVQKPPKGKTTWRYTGDE